MTEPPAGPPPGYQPPPPGYYGPPPGYFGPPRFEIGAAFSWAWKKFGANTGTLLTGGVVTLIAAIAMYALAVVIVFAVVPHPTLAMTNPDTGELDRVGRYFATFTVGYGALFLLSVPFAVITAGLIRTALRIADGESPGVGSVFSYRNAPRIMLTSFIVSLGTLIGIFLCYLPGLAFGLFAGFTLYFALDHRQGPFMAIKSSFALVKANFGNALVAMLLAGLVATGGAIACIVGMVFTVPFAILVHVYTYRFLSGGTVTP